eukprot:4743640-Amphidinium_carterae.1
MALLVHMWPYASALQLRSRWVKLQPPAPPLYAAPLLCFSCFRAAPLEMDFFQTAMEVSLAEGAKKRNQNRKGQDKGQQHTEGLKGVVQRLTKLTLHHDRRLRDLVAYGTLVYLLPSTSPLAIKVQEGMKAWRDALPAKGSVHPQGHPRRMVGGAFVNGLLLDADFTAKAEEFTRLHRGFKALTDMDESLQLAFVRTTQAGEVLIKLKSQPWVQQLCCLLYTSPSPRDRG